MHFKKSIERYVFILPLGMIFLIFGCGKKTIQPTPDPVPPPPPVVAKPIDTADMIYMAAGYTNDVFGINAQTGKVVWSQKVSGTYNSSAIYCNGRIVVKGRNMNLTAFDTAGNLQWTYQMLGNTESPDDIAIAADNGMIFAEDLEHVYAIHVEDGSVKWTYTKEANYDTLYNYNPNGSGAIIPKGNNVYINNSSGNLYAIDESTGILKWEYLTNTGYVTPVIYDDLIYQPSSGGLLVMDAHTGAVKKTLPFYGGLINMKYGKIYDAGGAVTDSATGTISYPSMQLPIDNFAPSCTIYPLLEDSLAILTSGICDAFTGQLICVPDVASPGYFLGGATYLNHILYYTTSQREEYNPYTGGKYYSDVYAYNVTTKSLLWHTAVENANFADVEPCVVTRSKKVYRGALNFK